MCVFEGETERFTVVIQEYDVGHIIHRFRNKNTCASHTVTMQQIIVGFVLSIIYYPS